MSTSERQRGRPLSVLVVDDWPDAAESLAAVLSAQGFTARTAKNGQEALQALQTEWPDVVLIDVAMPLMDGYALARRIRELSVAKQCPRMAAISGNAKPEDRLRSLAEGLDEHFIRSEERRVGK